MTVWYLANGHTQPVKYRFMSSYLSEGFIVNVHVNAQAVAIYMTPGTRASAEVGQNLH